MSKYSQEVDAQAVREWQREEGGGGYRQEAAAGIALDYYSMRERAERYTGLAAILADFDHGMEEALKQAPDGHSRLVRCMEREDEPELVDSLPALREAILAAHRASSHEALWERDTLVDGKLVRKIVWTPLQVLLRIEQDTVEVRSVAKRMKWHNKPSKPRLTTANRNSERGTCSVCGRDIDLGARVWIGGGRAWHAECELAVAG